MSHPAPSKLLRGIVPPMITPLATPARLDYDGLERLVERHVSGGVHGLFILGTTGEATSLGVAVRRELVGLVCRQVAGRVPVAVGVTDTNVEESVDLSRWAADQGADVIVVSCPYYLPPEQPELIAYATQLAREQPLPLCLYNMPGLTKTPYELETVRQLADIPRIVGIKDSSGDLAYLRGLVAQNRREDWTILAGLEKLLIDAVSLGADGSVPSGANLAPRLFVDLFNAATSGDAELAAKLASTIAKFQQIYQASTGRAAVIRGIKCALSLRGVCSDTMAAPFRGCTEQERKRIADLNLI